MDEGNHDLPWEEEVYNKPKQKKMAFKLRDGAGKQSPFNNLTKRGLTPLKQVEGEEPKSSVPEEYGDFEVVAKGPEKKKVKRKKAEGSGDFINKLGQAKEIGDASKALDILSTAKASTTGEKAALSKAMKKYKGQGGIATQY